MVKVTTLFLGAFFCCVMAPSYYKAEKPEWEVASGMCHLTLITHLIMKARI